MKRAATIEQVAELSKTSRSTVSRVLNNLPVSEATRQRVNTAIRELNYAPNHHARSLAAGHANTLAVFIPASLIGSEGSVVSEHFRTVASITKTANAMNYTTMLWVIPAEFDMGEAYHDLLKSRHIDAVIMAFFNDTWPLSKVLNHYQVPYTVVCDTDTQGMCEGKVQALITLLTPAPIIQHPSRRGKADDRL